MVRASASTATRSLFLLAVASCAPERAHDRAALVLPAVKATSTTTLVVHDVPTPVARVDLTIAPSGLVETMRDADLPASLVDEVDDAFVWRVDLFAHLRAGDAASVWHRDGKLVAASVPLHGDAFIVARYDGELAPVGFYDEDGLGMTSALRSRPVDLGRITSRFGQRFDVFTGAAGFHRGVDYGVPVGTPVVAVGAARVKSVGRSTSAGNFIKLAHAGGYESAYLHLDRIDVAKGDIVGANVVIARSGNTGRSTGPHVHYELRLAGIALDPLATMPSSTVALGPLARREHLAFIKHLQQMEDTHDGRTHR